uniref:DUF1538 domain-containing protein n=1 Tax=Zooxanthella nutricula TaxID=1333877 RepID=A0A7S2M9A0_9DINO
MGVTENIIEEISKAEPLAPKGGEIPRNWRVPDEAGKPARTEEEEGGPGCGELLREFMLELKDNLVAVFGLAAFIFLYALAFLKLALLTPSRVAYLAVAVGGLAFFALGIRHGLMPLGELVGARMPLRCSRPVVMTSVFALGVLCTIAEPAINALRKAGRNIAPERAPLLALILDYPSTLMLGIGVGVGLAAVFGAFRVLLKIKMRPCVGVLSVVCLVGTLACVWLGGEMPTVTGLAWDCGAVTTGPVTVPIVLALGLGIAASASKAPGQSPEVRGSEARRQSMRRASLVSALSERHARNPAPAASAAGQDSPDEDSDAGSGIVTFASLFPVAGVWTLAFGFGGPSAAVGAARDSHVDQESSLLDYFFDTVRAVVPLVGFLLFLQLAVVRERVPRPKLLAFGLACCFLGMFLFSIGLDRGLVPLGDAAGKALPHARERFGKRAGTCVIAAFGFLAGGFATFAEPALTALGETVERSSKGKFKKGVLVLAVALGVGSGIAFGFMKVYFELPLWPILTIGYSVCLALTALSDDLVASIAWDSAGVTTGPVTVPIVLASGLALGDEANVVEGFGILSCASIAPITSVLIAGILLQRRSAHGQRPARSTDPTAIELELQKAAVA